MCSAARMEEDEINVSRVLSAGRLPNLRSLAKTAATKRQQLKRESELFYRAVIGLPHSLLHRYLNRWCWSYR